MIEEVHVYEKKDRTLCGKERKNGEPVALTLDQAVGYFARCELGNKTSCLDCCRAVRAFVEERWKR